MSQPTSARVSRANALKAIFWGGLFCGTGDLTFAFVFYGARGATMQGIMQSIAGGLLGKAAKEGGATTAALGVALHYFIAFGAAAVFFAASRRWPVLIKHAVPSGLIYGAAVYFFMNMVVLPLSAYHARAFPPPLSPIPIVGHLFLVGLPIALAVRRFSRGPSASA
jgi:hypothetical protein